MRRDYTYLNQSAPIPLVQTTSANTDQFGTVEGRGDISPRRARQRAKLRRAKTAERWIALTVTSIMALSVLPVLAVIGALILARNLCRRWTGSPKSEQTSVRTDSSYADRHVCAGSREFRGTAAADVRSVGDPCVA